MFPLVKTILVKVWLGNWMDGPFGTTIMWFRGRIVEFVLYNLYILATYGK